MLDLMAFKATDVPAKNAVLNGNFIKDSNGDGIADNFFLNTSTENPRIENQAQYWTPLTAGAHSGSLQTLRNIPNTNGHLYYIGFTSGNIETVQWWPESSAQTITLNVDLSGSYSDVFTSLRDGENARINFYAREVGVESHVRDLIVVNLTVTFGAGNEPTKAQMEELIKQFPNDWFDGTKNLFNAQHFMQMYFAKITELENAITALGGGS